MLRWLVIFFLFIILSACATSNEASHRRPAFPLANAVTINYHTQEDGLYLIDVMLNGEGPFTFIVDSGATVSAVYPSVIQALNLDVSLDRSVQVHGIIASQERPLIDMPLIELSTLSWRDTPVVLLRPNANRNVDGVFGMDLFGGYALLFDHENQTITFLDSHKVPSKIRRSWKKVKLAFNPFAEDEYELVFAYARLGNRAKIPALLDFGSAISLQNWASARNAHLQKIRKQLEEKWRLSGAIGEFHPRVLATYESVTADEMVWYDKELYVRDLGSLDVMGVDDRPLVILGINFFKEETFLADFPGQTLYMKPKATNRTTPDAPIEEQLIDDKLSNRK